ncbi:MAG: hypothetical protein LUQ15_08430 [Methanothrix sp.]|nr:hypothetical protein [Methanothrix sp.]
MFGIWAMAEGMVSAAASVISALTRESAAAARMLEPPPIEWPAMPESLVAGEQEGHVRLGNDHQIAM